MDNALLLVEVSPKEHALGSDLFTSFDIEEFEDSVYEEDSLEESSI